MPRRLPSYALAALAWVGGCAHGAPSVATPPPSSAAAPAPAPRRVEEPVRYELVWRMQAGEQDQDTWAAVPPGLHAFALGPWECALGPQQTHDAPAGTAQQLSRSRRVACTHESGATVQTELRCALTLPVADGELERARRELPLLLSAAPTLRLTCEPARADTLATPHEPLPISACDGKPDLSAQVCTAR